MRLTSRNKGQKRAFALSFVVVFAILGGSYIGLVYLSGQIQVQHLPSKVPSYNVSWGKYIPADYLQASFENYTQARAVNASIPPNNVVLELVLPVINISTDQVNAILSVTMSHPNQTIDIAFLASQAYSQLSTVLQTDAHTSSVGTAPMYLVADSINGTLDVGWLGLVAGDHAAALALGGGQAQDGVTAILNSVLGNTASIISSVQVAQAAYIAGSNSDPLAVGFENFPGVVRTGNLTGTFVALEGGGISVSNVIGFNSSFSASSQYKYAKQVYNTYSKFTVYDSFIDAQAIWSFSRLEESLRLVGGA
ncbi:MAG: hypothetical protein JRN06_01755 [Nitrososphaerota archaeon]|nr:hypothetical protein [Nitrososphaerota archaeon]MDG7023420.1 hypothetical protein [Nitrososphaerota archaeon]